MPIFGEAEHKYLCVVNKPDFLSQNLANAAQLFPKLQEANLGALFFPASALWPVWPGQSTVSVRKKLYRSIYWGEAHCAGENVKRRTGPFQWKSLTNQTRTTTQQRGAARHGNQEPPGQAPRCTGRKKQPKHTRDFTDRSRYALTYIEMP